MKWAVLRCRGRQIWQAFFWMGFLNNVIPFGLIVWVQSYVTSGYASIINATPPLFAVLAAVYPYALARIRKRASDGTKSLEEATALSPRK